MSEIKDEIKEMNFEAAMSALEKLVERLERGDVELEKAIKLYEHGTRLKSHCAEKLREAESKIAAITLDKEGSPTGSTPFSET